jgi:hypothetical protein
MPDPNQDYNGPYTEAHLQDGTILKFKGDLDPISVKQKVATFKAGTSPTATSPELPKPEFSAGSSEGWMQDPQNQLKLSQSIGADTAMGAPGGVMSAEGAPQTIGKTAMRIAKNPRVQGAAITAASALTPHLPSWVRTAGEIVGGARLFGGGEGESAPTEEEMRAETQQRLRSRYGTTPASSSEYAGPATGVAARPNPPTISEPAPAPPADNINYEKNQQLNRRAITSAPSGREISGPATSSAPNPRPIPGVPQPTPEPAPPTDTIDYERNQRLNRANLTRSIGSTQPSGPATGGAPPTVGRSPQAGAAVPYGRSVTAGDLATWSKDDLWAQYMKEREAGGSRDLMKRISDELARRGETKAVGSQIK